MNNKAFAGASTLFVSGLAVNGENFRSVEAQLCKQEAVEAGRGDAERAADPGKGKGGVAARRSGLQQAGKSPECKIHRVHDCKVL